MRPHSVKQASQVKGKISFAGDKSIAHRSIILSAVTCAKTVIRNFPANKDCLHTLEALKKLGIKISLARQGRANTITVSGKRLRGLKEPRGPVFMGDSGTSLRLLMGVLAGQNFSVTLTAAKSLSLRPMLRVTRPLRMMGADIKARLITHNARREEYPPITIKGGNLKAIRYKMAVASAQVKSAILLAGLFTKGKTSVIEPIKTRDHTERMLKLFKADIKVNKNKIFITGGKELVSPGEILIPGDISSASFFIVLGAILPDSQILIKNVSLNPSRTGIVKVLKRMGANIKVMTYDLPASPCLALPRRQAGGRRAAGGRLTTEPAGDLIVKSSRLKGVIVRKEEAPSLIDELPILMVASCFARGRTLLEGVEELRVKETDRIRSMSSNLRKMGAHIEIIKRGRSERVIIKGKDELRGAAVESFGDHRTAMSMVVAGLKASGTTRIDDIACVDKSFPDFLTLLKKLIK